MSSNKPAAAVSKLSSNSNSNSKSIKPATSSPPFTVNPVWSTVEILCHVLFSFLCIYLTPFGRTSTLASSSFTVHLYDLLYTEKVAEFDRSLSDAYASYVGPALLAAFVRPFNFVLDEKIRSLVFDKVVPLATFLPASVVATAKLYILETRMWQFFIARAFLATIVALSAYTLRNSLALKFKSSALPRIYTALSLASVVTLLAVTNLSSQAFSVVLLNLALAAVFKGKFAQSFSLLTVNAVIFDSIGGSIILVAAFVSFGCLETFKRTVALASALATFPVAALVTVALDSLFYNKFIWPQGEVLFRYIYALVSAFRALNRFELLKFVLSLKPVELVNSKQFANALFVLAPAVIIYILGRSNRYVRAMLCFYTLSTLGNVINAHFSGLNALITCTPLLAPLFVAASLSVLGGLKPASGSRVRKSLTGLFFFGVLIPALGWSFGRIHLEIASAQQSTGEALMALNRKILKEAQEGIPVRVFIDSDSASAGYSRFIELSRNQAVIYSTTEFVGRYDYFVGPPAQCPQDKAMKVFSGFSKFDIKALQIIKTELVGVYRHSSTCPSAARPHPVKLDTSNFGPARLPTFISVRFFNSQFSGLNKQREFISKYLGRFNPKKISNSVTLIAYLYQNLLEQI